jgi:hypothetical protein
MTLSERVIDTIKAALFQAREIERRFAQSLAGNGTSIDATAAHVACALDQGDALAKIDGLGPAFSPAAPQPITTRSKLSVERARASP